MDVKERILSLLFNSTAFCGASFFMGSISMLVLLSSLYNKGPQVGTCFLFYFLVAFLLFFFSFFFLKKTNR